MRLRIRKLTQTNNKTILRKSLTHVEMDATKKAIYVKFLLKSMKLYCQQNLPQMF